MTDGERWAADELCALRAARFTPGGWCRLFAASLTRAGETRRARPSLARQARRWSLLGLCAATASRSCAPRLRLSAPPLWAFGTWWLCVAVMLEWHLGMVEGTEGERRDALTAADALTLLRLWAVPLLAAQGDATGRSGPAFAALIAGAGATDVLDGTLARRAGATRLGRDLDKVADVIVFGVAARAASRAGWLPAPSARLAMWRSVLPVAYAAAYYFRTGERPRVDSLGPGRRLAPALLGGLALAPFRPRAAAALTGAASVASLALVAVRPQ